MNDLKEQHAQPVSRTVARFRFEGTVERFPGQRPTGVQKVSRQFQLIHFTLYSLHNPESIGMSQRGSCAVVQVGAVTRHAEEEEEADVWFSDAICSEWPFTSPHTIGL